MTTDITELAQSLKAAAENAIGAHERLAAYPYGEIIDISQHEGEQIDIDITDLNEFNKEANPVNILALVEALEKAQQVDEELCKLLPPGVEYMDPPDGGDVTPLEGVRRMVADYRQLIAELESRTVKLPKPHAHLIWIQAGHAPDDYWDDVAVSHSEKDRCCDGSERYPVYARWEIEEMMSAAGIKVEAE
ncbi:phage EaA protein [Klebsiella pneumoniae]|uniref:ead/Ea22-like family protein n=1 Tax=Klebsiella pneumoniae TaxID=573 RepID=UPI0010F3F8E2|nr:ead/Ea22-like family protein [Klebsiella pneumoniae]VGD32217.1 phage EaA protein [Klebsiella pneumoniae]